MPSSQAENQLDNDKEELRQKLASIEHERWADWQKWVHTVYENPTRPFEEAIANWKKQINTPYSDLTEREKASDMEQVDRYWHLIDQYTQSKLKAFAGEVEKAIGEDEYPEQHFPTVLQGENIEKYDKVTARDRLRAELRQALKAIKGKYQL